MFTTWYRALRAAVNGTDDAEARYRKAAQMLDGAGMPGVEQGLLPLALLSLHVWHATPIDHALPVEWGPYRPWAEPWLALARGDHPAAATALRRCPDPPPGLLAEALWCLVARAAVVLGDAATARTACAALRPAAGEIAGAASGLLTAGPVQDYLTEAGSLLS